MKHPPFPKNYAPEFLVLDHGEGVYLYDENGNRFLDFGSGIAVNALGYGRDDLAETAYKQMLKTIHVSNLFTTRPAVELAQKLTDTGPFAAVHFGNSGSEANEAAIKYARLYSLRTRGEGNHKILTFHNGFHGRTMGALSCTATPKYQDPFKPLIEGVVTADLNDADKLQAILDQSFAAVIVEVIQGEGGLFRMTKEFAETLNGLCKKHDVLIIVDEVQTGLSRTGSLYAYQSVGLKPDIVTLSKPLAGGLPLSATLIPEKVNALLHVGEHGTTFGGGPVTTTVGCLVFDTVSSRSFIDSIKKKGEYLASLLREVQSSVPAVMELRGAGLLQGIVIDEEKLHADEPIKTIMGRCRDQGLLILRSGTNVLRFAPPLIIEEEELREGVEIIKSILQELS